MTNPDPQRDLHTAATDVIRALDEPGINPEYHAKQRAHLRASWPVLWQRLQHLRDADTFSTTGTTEYGIEVTFPDQQFMHPILGHRGAWTTDKALAEHDLAALRENDQLRDANIRIIARHISPTWEVKE